MASCSLRNASLSLFALWFCVFLWPKILLSQQLNKDVQVAVLQERIEEGIRINFSSALRLREFKQWDLAAENLDLALKAWRH